MFVKESAFFGQAKYQLEDGKLQRKWCKLDEVKEIISRGLFILRHLD